jgi:hypothetical protein
MIATTPSGCRIDVTSTRADTPSEKPPQQVGHAAREVDDLEPAADLAEGVAQVLAVLGGDDRGEVLRAEREQLAKPEHHLGAFRQRRRPPRRKGRGRSRYRGVDVVGRGERDTLGDAPGRRVEHLAVARRRTLRGLAVDPG